MMVWKRRTPTTHRRGAISKKKGDRMSDLSFVLNEEFVFNPLAPEFSFKF
jgi:hypothetical protein